MKPLFAIFCGLCLALCFSGNVQAQTIINQPQNLTINDGSAAQFTVVAADATNYQWQFNGSNLTDGGNITGSTNSALMLDDVSTNQAGTYTVVINNSVTSSNAILTVLPGTVVTFILTNFPGGGSSNISVELFNHDKPVTVQNFLHYVTSGAYTNMFMDRCYPDFVLQGGDDGASDRTSTNPPITGWNVEERSTTSTNFQPPFPAGIINEFGAGPLIHNRPGTLAMALGDNTNSATSAFFFNLVDNSFLDSESFTVFGRVLDGTDVLDYFSNLANGNGGVSDGQILIDGELQPVPNTGDASLLPVNYFGTQAPANTNLIFCDFAVMQPPGSTNLPAVAIASPVTNIVLSNNVPLVVQGTATDPNLLGLAWVRCDLIPLPGVDGTLPNGGMSLTNYILGATNWSANLGFVPPGQYELGVQVEDEASNLSAEVFIQPVTISAVFAFGDGDVIVTQGVSSNVEAGSYPFQIGSNYTVTATAGTNGLLVNWNNGGVVSFDSNVSFTMSPGFLLTATFISNGIPNGLAIDYPTLNTIVTNTPFNITGTVSNVPSLPVTVTCQIYSASTGLAVGSPLSTSTTSNWSVTASLLDDSYIVEATAVDAAGNSTVVTQNFTVTLVPVIVASPQSILVNTASTAEFTVVASNALNYQWQFEGTNISGATGSELTLEDVSTNQEGGYTVIVSAGNLSVTSSPPAMLSLTNGTIVQFILSGLTNGSPSNVVNVELFDHDKPATVANFLHYIRSGAYTNMFFQRCLPNFILQGGEYGAIDRTNTSSPMEGWDIGAQFVTASNQLNPPFPPQLDSELGVGPFIHNRFGTIAMALNPNETNSATSSFFFNLIDNSSPLDTEYGGFTVFGRIIDSDGTNILNYFNGLSDNDGISTNGVFFDQAVNSTNLTLTDLPVNYAGTNLPANTNLIFCDFFVPTNAPIDTNPPTVSLASPVAGTVTTNGNPLIQGTASDDVGLAVVTCVLIPQAAADGTYPNSGISITNYPLGTTNWSLNFNNPNDPDGAVPPGTYNLIVQSQDGAGNLSPAILQPFIVTAVVTNGAGSVTFAQGVFSDLNAVGYPFQIGSNYILMATPPTNGFFIDWTADNYQSIYPSVEISMTEGTVVTATFLSNGIPNSLAFLNPPLNGTIDTNAFSVSGTISNVSATPVNVTSQIYSTQTYQPVGPPLVTSGMTDWFESPTNLAVGSYIVQAIGIDQNGNSTVITNAFNVSTYATLGLTVVGPGTVPGFTNNQPIFVGTTIQPTAMPNPGQSFYAWSNGPYLSLNPVQTYTMSSGLSLGAIFVTNNTSNMITFTYPKANDIVGTNTLYLTGNISNVLATPVTVTCQIFSKTNSLAVSQLLETSGTANWEIGVAGLGVGSYTVLATASNAVGQSTLISEDFSIAYVGNVHLVIVGKGSVSPITDGESLSLGSAFQVTATPGAGQAFYTWNDGTDLLPNAVQTFTMSEGLTLTATFVPSNTAKGITITYPALHANLKTNAFSIKGKIAPAMKSAAITCQFFQSNGVAVGQPMITQATNTWSIPVTNLPGGYYVIEAQATNADGKSTLVSQDFTILPFAEVQGTYTGLFICTNQPVAPTNSGFLTFTLTPYGAMSGKLEFPAYAAVPIFSLPFENVEFTEGFVQFNSTNFHGSPLNGLILMDLVNGTDIAVGTISSSNWSSQLTCYKATTQLSTNSTPAIGKYMLNLQAAGQTNGPFTNGYATLNVARGGVMSLSGALPDDTKFSQSPKVAANGMWPLYAVPAGDKTSGLLLGWETFTNQGDCNGQLYWYKAPKVGAYYTNGVGLATNFVFNSTGTNFSRPVSGAQYSIVLQGGSVAPPLTNILQVTKSGQFSVVSGPADKLKISLSANGVLTGSFFDVDVNKTIRLAGAFTNPSQGGGGFIPETSGQTGSFELKLVTP